MDTPLPRDPELQMVKSLPSPSPLGFNLLSLSLAQAPPEQLCWQEGPLSLWVTGKRGPHPQPAEPHVSRARIRPPATPAAGAQLNPSCKGDPTSSTYLSSALNLRAALAPCSREINIPPFVCPLQPSTTRPLIVSGGQGDDRGRSQGFQNLVGVLGGSCVLDTPSSQPPQLGGTCTFKCISWHHFRDNHQLTQRLKNVQVLIVHLG